MNCFRKVILVNHPYLAFPVSPDGEKTHAFASLWENDTMLYEFFLDLDFENPRFWTYCDMRRYDGRELILQVEDERITQEQFDQLSCRDTFPGEAQLYREPGRPQLHFSPARGYISDPNGLFYNQSICLYIFDRNARFGRLMVCSKAIADTTGKSMDLEKYGLMVPSLEEGEVWSNNERLLGYPEYAAPIFQDGRLVALITIQKTRFDQMAMYYQNLIKVLCGLIQAALLRAVEFMAYTEADQFIEGTRIMKKEAFRKVLAVRAEMEEKAVAEYSLLHIAVTPEQIHEAGERISRALRSIDVVGQGADGDLYVILTQTGQENIGVVLERLKRCGIGYQDMDDAEKGEATV